MSPITTHILDTARGCPAADVPVGLERQNQDGSWCHIGEGQTDEDGRNKALMAAGGFGARHLSDHLRHRDVLWSFA